MLVLKRVRDLEIVLGPGPVPGFDIFLGPELTGFGPWIPVCIGVTKPENWKITTSALTRKIVQVLLDDGSITDVTILGHGVRVSLVGKVTMVHSLWFKNEQFETLKSFFLDL